jgi:hypothetical protein
MKIKSEIKSLLNLHISFILPILVEPKQTDMKNFTVIVKIGNKGKSVNIEAENNMKAMFAAMSKFNCGASAILEIIEA